MKRWIEDLQMYTLVDPIAPVATVDSIWVVTPPNAIKLCKWQQEYSLLRQRIDVLNKNLRTCCNVICGQCSYTLKNKVEGRQKVCLCKFG